MSQLKKFAEVIRYCVNTYQRSVNEALFDNIFWRTPEEIKASGEIHYLCCTERTLIVSQHALERGLESKLIIIRIKRPAQRVKVGAALEITLDGVNYRFVSANSGGDSLKPNVYVPSRKRTCIYAVSASLDDSISFFSHFGIDSVQELEKYIPGFDFYRFVKKIRRKAGVRHFNKCQKRIANKRSKRKLGILVGAK